MTYDIALVTMPWSSLSFPSIQLGTVASLLARDGISTRSFHYNLRFAEFAIGRTASLPPAERVTLQILHQIAESQHIGEWIFAVPPFRERDDASDQAFRELTEQRSIPGGRIETLYQLRELAEPFLASCADELIATGVRVVAFTSSFNQNVSSLALAKMLKQRSREISIVFGGANCDGVMGAALHALFPWVDVVVRGEAERVAAPVFAALLARQPVPVLPGVCVRNDGVSVAHPLPNDTVPMTDVPAPDYTDYIAAVTESPLAGELVPSIRLLYESARGCWWGEKNHCTFCGLNGSTMKFRSKPPSQTFDEMVDMAQRYHSLRFQVVDNIIEMGYLRELLPRLRETGWNWDVFYETKANLKKAQLRLFREAGVRTIQPGIESLSTPTLKLMNKGVTALQNIRLLKWCAELEIRPAWNLIFGFPGEDPAEYERMAQVIPSLVHFRAPAATPLAVERFSPYFNEPARYGIEIVGPAARYPLFYPFTRTQLTDLAYAFEYRYLDGRTPTSYAQPMLAAVTAWNAASNTGALIFEKGPGFITIDDHRTTVDPAHYTFEEEEAAIYLACDAGATPAQVRATLIADGHDAFSEDEIREFLDGLVESRLVYEERGRYLSLAIDRDPLRALRGDAEAADEAEPAPGLIAIGRKRAS